MNIWLIRHGMTLACEEGRYQGFLDESLSEKGREVLVKAPYEPSHIYVSPAKRARETASILFPGAEQICIPDLWEMNFGAFEGKTWKEMENDPQYREWVDGWCLGTCPGGESRASFSSRVCSAFLDVLKREKERNDSAEDLFIVSHGGTQMAILEKWGRPARNYYDWQRPCGCGWKLSLKDSASAEPASAAVNPAGYISRGPAADDRTDSAADAPMDPAAANSPMNPTANAPVDPAANESFELHVLEETCFAPGNTRKKM
jgi:alpha-ribazole phosphatase